MCLQKSASLWHVTRRRWKNFGLWPLTPTSDRYSSLSITDGWEDNYPMKTTHPNGVSQVTLWKATFHQVVFVHQSTLESSHFIILLRLYLFPPHYRRQLLISVLMVWWLSTSSLSTCWWPFSITNLNRTGFSPYIISRSHLVNNLPVPLLSLSNQAPP